MRNDASASETKRLSRRTLAAGAVWAAPAAITVAAVPALAASGSVSNLRLVSKSCDEGVRTIVVAWQGVATRLEYRMIGGATTTIENPTSPATITADNCDVGYQVRVCDPVCTNWLIVSEAPVVWLVSNACSGDDTRTIEVAWNGNATAIQWRNASQTYNAARRAEVVGEQSYRITVPDACGDDYYVRVCHAPYSQCTEIEVPALP